MLFVGLFTSNSKDVWWKAAQIADCTILCFMYYIYVDIFNLVRKNSLTMNWIWISFSLLQTPPDQETNAVKCTHQCFTHGPADRMAHKIVFFLSANHRCVLWPVDQWEYLIFIALNLWAVLSKCP